MSEKVQTKVYLPERTKSLLDKTQRSNSELVAEAIELNFGSEDVARIERRIEEKKRENSELQSQVNERLREIEENNEEIERMEQRLQTIHEQQNRELEMVLEDAKLIPADPANHFVQKNADEIGLNPEELAEKIAERWEKELVEQ